VHFFRDDLLLLPANAKLATDFLGQAGAAHFHAWSPAVALSTVAVPGAADSSVA
jgi:hypothetical protein